MSTYVTENTAVAASVTARFTEFIDVHGMAALLINGWAALYLVPAYEIWRLRSKL